MHQAAVFLSMLAAGFFTSLLAASFCWAVLEARRRAAEAGAAGVLLNGSQLSTIRLWAALLERFSQADALRQLIRQAGVSWTAGRTTLLMLFGAASVGLFLLQMGLFPAWLRWTLAMAAGAAPVLYLRAARARRFRLFAEQFPEALDSLSRALRAGYPLAHAIDLLALEQPEPLAAEMRRTRDEWKLGVPWDQALDNLSARIPLPEVAMFCAAVKLQNRHGGRLNDVLARLSETMREHSALEGEVRSVTAHSRLTGAVLTALPLLIALLLFWVNPEQMAILLRRPEGRTMLAGSAAAVLAAHVVIRWMTRIRM
ncbi:MAG: type II secretion system F family protein [Bryobacteraceae bacterium]|nr:type II secretion system F family protein [Bryobacteraceae bacterium]MCX7603919.1 type II secretion system F family protein [Bryobacteraceae bacterium]